jgi:hypothetical protein
MTRAKSAIFPDGAGNIIAQMLPTCTEFEALL